MATNPSKVFITLRDGGKADVTFASRGIDGAVVYIADKGVEPATIRKSVGVLVGLARAHQLAQEAMRKPDLDVDVEYEASEYTHKGAKK